MIMLIAAMMLAGGGNGADSRHDFVTCLKQASVDAKSKKIGADGFADFAKTSCAAVEAPFKASLVSTDVSHGMSRRDSDSDAASQISDYYSERADSYKFEVESAQPQEPAAEASTKTDVPAKPQ